MTSLLANLTHSVTPGFRVVIGQSPTVEAMRQAAMSILGVENTDTDMQQVMPPAWVSSAPVAGDTCVADHEEHREVPATKNQARIQKLLSTVRLTDFLGNLAVLPMPMVHCEKKPSAVIARHRNLCEPGATACLRVISSDRFEELSSVECALLLRQFLGKYIYSSTAPAQPPTFAAMDISTRHGKNCTRSGAQTLQHYQVRVILVQALCDIGAIVIVGDLSPFVGGHGGISIYIVIPVSGLPQARSPGVCTKMVPANMVVGGVHAACLMFCPRPNIIVSSYS